MASLQERIELKNRIEVADMTKRQMIATAAISQGEITRAEEVGLTFQGMFETFNDSFGVVVHNNPSLLTQNQLVAEARPHDKPTAFVLMGTDRELCGSHNTDLVATAFQLEQKIGKKDNIAFIVIGSLITELLQQSHRPVVKSFPSTSPEKMMTIQDLAPLYTHLLNMFSSGDYENIHAIYYTHDSPYPIFRQILPIPLSSLPDHPKSVSVEPDNAKMLQWLLTHFVIFTIYRDFLTNAVHEFEARRETATTGQVGAQRLKENLILSLNKARRQAITAETISLSNQRQKEKEDLINLWQR